MFSGWYTACIIERTTSVSMKGLQRRILDARRDLLQVARGDLGRQFHAHAHRARSVFTSVSSLRSSGSACTRYSVGRWCRSSASAAATLASTMHSSISRCASLRSGRSMAVICSASFSTNFGSGASKSSAPRRPRAFSSTR